MNVEEFISEWILNWPIPRIDSCICLDSTANGDTSLTKNVTI